MSATLPRILLTAVISLGAVGCTTTTRDESPVSPEEQLVLDQLTRDRYLDLVGVERDDLDHLVVTTRQGSERVRYVIMPSRPGEKDLVLHRINDRSTIEVEDSDQLGTGPQPGRNGRYR